MAELNVCSFVSVGGPDFAGLDMSDEALDEGQRPLGDVLPAVVDREGMAATRDLLDLECRRAFERLGQRLKRHRCHSNQRCGMHHRSGRERVRDPTHARAEP